MDGNMLMPRRGINPDKDALCRYRSLAGHSLRALRLDLALAVLHHLQDLPSNNWACKEEEATEVFFYTCH